MVKQENVIYMLAYKNEKELKESLEQLEDPKIPPYISGASIYTGILSSHEETLSIYLTAHEDVFLEDGEMVELAERTGHEGYTADQHAQNVAAFSKHKPEYVMRYRLKNIT